MSRFLSAALAAGIGLLAVAAFVDALRDDAVGPASTGPVSTREAGAEAEMLAAAGITGRILYTDAANCSLRGLALPDLRPTEAPGWDTCAFALGPGAAVAPAGTVFDGRRGLMAEEFDGGVDVGDPRAETGRRFENARAPAFRPHGTLTIVQRGGLVALTPCPGDRPAIEAVGSCRATLATEEALTSLAQLSVDPRPLRLALETVVWLSDETFAALAQAGESDVVLGVDVGGARPQVEVWFEDDALTDLELSPRRRFVSVVTATGELGVFDPGGTLLGLRGSQVRAAAWSPDERWLAVLDGGGLLFVGMSDGAGVGPVPLPARDLAWG